MARALRLESENGSYHIISRGNYRAPVFRDPNTKLAFLDCLAEACAKTGWLIHAWCLMSNHYHLALTTPRANLVEGMTWLQGTFAIRFNRFRDARGHLFQGRYKSLAVEDGDGLGAVCHYIHLNPVRANLCSPPELATYRWTSLPGLLHPKFRPDWHRPSPALIHAGNLSDTTADRHAYLDYLGWLAENEPEQKRLKFGRMTKGWAIGSQDFVRKVMQENVELCGRSSRLHTEMRAEYEAYWLDELTRLLARLDRNHRALAATGKSEPWKVALAAVLKSRTTVTNRWLSTHLHLGNLHEVSRKISAWRRAPDRALLKQLAPAPNPKI